MRRLYACVVATALLASATAFASEGPDVRLDDRRPSSRSLGFPTDLTARSRPIDDRTAQRKALGTWNMTQVGALDIHAGYNDIWGYTDEFGTEYAILGVVDGTSIINVSNPAAPVETGFIPAIRPSTWRDMKTYGDYCYVVSEAYEVGMQIIDLTDPENPFLAATYAGFSSAHNLFIEEATGRGYICGHFPDFSGGSTGGVHVVDLTNPTAPVFLGEWSGSYVHDLYVENNIAYLAEIWNASLSVVDFTNPASPVVLAGPQGYPYAFTHNTWLTQDGNYVLTTDENVGGRIRVWDLQNPPALTQVAEWQTPETNSIIHNVLIDEDRALISYYTEGTRVLDVSDPLAPVEIAYYDNYAGASGTFDGIWGVYPFLPSGRILSSDIDQGLLILEVGTDWAKVSGTITEPGVGVVEGAQVEFVGAASVNPTSSSVFGKYGLAASPGTYTLRVTAEGFFDHEQPVTIANGAPLTADVELFRRPNGTVSGYVDGRGLLSLPHDLAGATVELLGTSKKTTTDAAGNYSLSQVPEGIYTMRVTRAGFGQVDLPITATPFMRTYNVTMDRSPWYDGADADTGWTLGEPTDTATSGAWVRGVPVGSSLGVTQVQPGSDATPAAPFGASEPASTGACFVTGNALPGEGQGVNDIDNGITTLTSPTVDLSGYADPRVAYSVWHYTSVPLSDPLSIEMSDDDGQTWTVAQTLTSMANEWTRVALRVEDFVSKTNQFKIRFGAADLNPQSIAEMAIDDVEFFDPGTDQVSDCNGNGIPDAEDVAGDPVLDCNTNGFLDSCETTGLTTYGQAPLSGWSYGIATEGTYAYVTNGNANRVDILDVSDPTAPVVISGITLAGRPFYSVRVDNYLYVAAYDAGLYVLDVTNVPGGEVPVQVGYMPAPNHILRLVHRGDYLYLPAENNDFQIASIADRENPTIVGTLATPDDPKGVVLSGDYAFVSAHFDGMYVIDISDPTTPTLAGQVDTPEKGLGIARLGDDHVIVADISSLQIIDVSTPTDPSVVATVPSLNFARNVHVDGDIAYVTTADGLLAYDVSNPLLPVLLDQLVPPAEVYQSVLVQDRLVLACSSYGVAVANPMKLDGNGDSIPDECQATAVPELTPSRYLLHPATPNPFNPSTTIRFELPQAGKVDLTIYDVAGRRVRTLVQEAMAAGRHEVVWRGDDQNGRRVASGVYLYRLRAGSYEETRRMTLLK